jgi:2-desacetyl-2-hydroxyethyl bacteriochlorophyllide A dehydrogenase
MYRPRGGHVSPAVCARDQVWKLPPEVAAGGVEAALAYAGLVLTQVGYNCGARAALARGETALVIGDGLVGHWAAQTLAWRGAAVTLVGHHAARLERFQAGATLLASGAEWPQPVAAAQSGAGLRVLVDTVGSVAAIAAALPHMARDGGIVSAGFYGTEDRIGLQSLRFGEQTLYAVSGWTRPRMDRTLELIAAGAITTIPLITHRFPVSQAAAAWELINSRAEGVLGVVLEWEQ